MTPPVRRVFAPLALLAGGLAALFAGLVLLAACRREIAARPLTIEGAEPRSAVLRMCADPGNLPFLNERDEGFENRLGVVLARARGETLASEWHAQRRGSVRETLTAGRCDVILRVPASHERVLATPAHHRSTSVLDEYGVPRAPRGTGP